MQRKLRTHSPKSMTYIFNCLFSNSVANTVLYLNTEHKYIFLLKCSEIQISQPSSSQLRNANLVNINCLGNSEDSSVVHISVIFLRRCSVSFFAKSKCGQLLCWNVNKMKPGSPCLPNTQNIARAQKRAQMTLGSKGGQQAHPTPSVQ